MLSRGVLAACGSRAIWARHCRGPRALSPRGLLVRGAASVAAEAPAAAAAPAPAAPAFKANLDFKFVKDNLALVIENCKARNSNADPARVAALYDEFTRLKQESDALRAARNENSAAMKGKLEPDARQALIARGQALKSDLESLEAALSAAEAALQLEGQRLPNLTHPDAPLGGEDAAAVLRTVGRQRDFVFDPRDHVAIGEALDLLDFEAAAEVSGSKFYYLKNAAALLELALVNYAMNKVVSRGFTPIMTPDLVKASVLEKCGFQPRADNTQVYSVEDSPLCLTGTAEVPLGGVYMDQVLLEKQLPIRMAAFGHCFRTEAGAAGAAGKGLYRVHQFSKVEMFVVCAPGQSDALHAELIDLEAEMFEELGLHFKVLDMPSGDLGAPAYRKFDVEAWMPGLGRYGEVSSASNCTDYQARRLNIRYRPSGGQQQQQQPGKAGKGGATAFCHTLNATACAVPRMIVAILENFQQEDGSVTIPKPLRPYLGGMEAILPPAEA
ncbi:seryl-tRNA synthetase [Raphidocelis subcapitata]|uniref:serine--tRNA ligase n=1 Tax=Raphidocelis subcapitata TaxID=307507 RepID=A0A2V0P6H5_9CHLO|nr:seryl-tRNA synthetase [Raphidocelis subcapitata]|eukprot:GBF92787.1 seryl-tRNA synthetase [Raphidocelis subcapitata]